MSDTKPPQASGFDPSGADAASQLAQIKRRQQQVIKSALAPVWYWSLMAAAIVAIGAARDSHHRVVLSTVIPLAVLTIAALIGWAVSGVRRRVQVHSAAFPAQRAALALTGLIVLVNAVIIAASASLVATRVPHPLTIGYAAGGATLVLGGLLLNRYLGRIMLTRASQPLADKPVLGSTPWHGLLGSDQGAHSDGASR
jgi:hypothetical protein